MLRIAQVPTGGNWRTLSLSVLIVGLLAIACLGQGQTASTTPISIAAAKELARSSALEHPYCIIRATVTTVPGSNPVAPGNFTVQDNAGAMIVRTSKVLPLTIWEIVELRGTLAWNKVKPKEESLDEVGYLSMTADSITSLGAGTQIPGRLLTRSDVRHGLYPVELVRVRGKVMRFMIGDSDQQPGDTSDYVVIGPEPELLAVFRRRRSDPPWVSERAVPGSEVELNGMLTFSSSAQEFGIRLRTPTDVAVIQPSSWFTLTRVLVLASVVVLLVGICVAWIVLLKRTIRKRTTEIQETEQQLQQAQKMEVLNQLAGGIAHDFNNILMAMTGYAELLMLEDIDSVHKKTLSEILKAGERGARLTRQLLTFSRKHPVKPTFIDINSLVSELQPMLSRIVGKDIHIEAILTEIPAIVRADRSHLEQVLINFAANSRDAMPTGGKFTIATSVVTTASRTNALAPGRYVRVAVSDTGYGMDARTLSRVFDPFFTTKGIGKGTGLGLSTVHGIVRQNEGDVRAESMLGKGTTFTVYLPYKEGHVEGEDGDEHNTIEPKFSGNVLIVDDDDQIREGVSEYLRRIGFDVYTAGDGADALRLASREQIDVLITDVVMPGMSGVELFQILSSSNPRLKVIFVSGHAERVIDYGATKLSGPLLKKPFKFHDLQKTIQAILNSARTPLSNTRGRLSGTRVDAGTHQL